MATSSSDLSGDAPVDFHLTSSVEDSGSRLSNSLVEKCLLCCNARKTFYCKQCVQNGDFLHSSRYQERFAEKQLQLTQLNNKKRKIQEECEQHWEKHDKASQMRYEIDACRERTRLLQLQIAEKKEIITQGEHKTLAELRKMNKAHSLKLPRYAERVNKLKECVAQVAANIETKQLKQMEILQLKLKAVIRASIQKLIQYIFPITQVHPVPSVEDCEAVDTVSALADATRTAYIRGRWVLTDSSGELQHCIVAPYLPGSGDYSAYSDWVAANKGNSIPGGNSETLDHNRAYSISAALTYTTQLINVIAFYLDVRLPTKLSYSEFCSHELTDHQFARRVARLNSNVLYLCFSQNVNPELLHPSQTLHNILHLIDVNVTDLGRQGPLEVDAILAKSLEDQIIRDVDFSSESGSDDESDNLPLEWEAVPHVACPESAPGSFGPQQSVMGVQQATSMAGGLVTSAAASIASLWRGWTTK